MILDNIPSEITSLIKVYLWGSASIWKSKLNITSWKLARQLVDLNYYPHNTTYCSKCGEKKYIFNYNNSTCFCCNNSAQKYIWKYTTWSGTNQGHFKLHGKTICLYSGPLAPLEKNIL